jgi:hypothetical protein
MPERTRDAGDAVCGQFSFLTRPSFSTAHRKRFKTSATLGKPLIRKFLLYRSGKLLSKSSGSGLCVAQ